MSARTAGACPATWGKWTCEVSAYTAARLAGPRDALPLDQIPPLVLSEILCDVDLLVGVGRMEPNDQYLCIVQDPKGGADNLFLPFEGDARLSLILSKTFLLAADTTITDQTIVRHITQK